MSLEDMARAGDDQLAPEASGVWRGGMRSGLAKALSTWGAWSKNERVKMQPKHLTASPIWRAY